jgi:hypothetical protein
MEGVGGEDAHKTGLRIWNCIAKCTWIMSRKFLEAHKRLPLFTETEATLSVDIVRVEFNLNGLPGNVVHISGFCGEDGRIVQLNVVSMVDNVFSYSRLVLMF